MAYAWPFQWLQSRITRIINPCRRLILGATIARAHPLEKTMTILTMLSRRLAAVSVVAGSLLSPLAAGAAEPITITDVDGRQVVLQQPAKRVLLGEGRYLNALALLTGDPVSLVAGWLGDFRRLDAASYATYQAKFPAIDQVPMVGVTSEETFSIEKALSVEPDLAIFGTQGHGPSRTSEAVQQLTAAGIPVIFLDFRAQPLENTIPSMTALGRAIGREKEAQAFVDFYEARMRRISDRLAAAKPVKPSVLMDMHAGSRDCCASPGKGNLGSFIEFAGGHNIGADLIPGPLGPLNLEYIIDRNPDVYIATGVTNRANVDGVLVGTGIPEAETEASLRKVTSRPGISTLTAVAKGRVHALWHNFYNSPLNVVAVEALATWIHPDLFKDVDPAATLEEINSKFLAVPNEGAFWASLD
jgi:iron complex transport system substrate-binding protein